MPQAPKLQMTTAMALARKLGLMSQIYNNRLANLLKAKDITYPQYEVLNFILRSGAQGTTIMKITEGVEILQPAVTKTVNKFVKRGLLLSRADSADKRVKHISITPEGAAFIGSLQASLMPDVLTCFEDWDTERTEKFTQELGQFRRWLEENRL